MIWQRKPKSSEQPDVATAPPAVTEPVAAPPVVEPAVQPVSAGRLHGGGPVVSPESEVEPAPISPEAPEPAPEAPAVEPASPKVRRKKVVTGARVAWVLAMSSIGAAVGGVIILGIKFIDSPVEGSTTKTVLSAQASVSPTPGINQLTGMYIELMYPGVFDQVGQVKNDAQALEQFNMGTKTDSTRMIAVSVRNLPEARLEEESGYRFRSMRPAEYAAKTAKILGEDVTIMTRRDKTEATLFWPHGKMVAVVSITSTNPKDDVSAFLAVVMKDIRWRR